MRKTREQIVSDNIWGAPACFVTAAFLSFLFMDGPAANRVGWTLYACGWLPPLAMLAWCAVKRRRPGVGGAVSFTILLVFGAVFALTHT